MMVHIILCPSDENVSPQDAVTVGPFPSEIEADAWIKEFQKVRPEAVYDVLTEMMAPSDALSLFTPEY
jgi:hypothetical protein